MLVLLWKSFQIRHARHDQSMIYNGWERVLSRIREEFVIDPCHLESGKATEIVKSSNIHLQKTPMGMVEATPEITWHAPLAFNGRIPTGVIVGFLFA